MEAANLGLRAPFTWSVPAQGGHAAPEGRVGRGGAWSSFIHAVIPLQPAIGAHQATPSRAVVDHVPRYPMQETTVIRRATVGDCCSQGSIPKQTPVQIHRWHQGGRQRLTTCQIRCFTPTLVNRTPPVPAPVTDASEPMHHEACPTPVHRGWDLLVAAGDISPPTGPAPSSVPECIGRGRAPREGFSSQLCTWSVGEELQGCQ